MSSPEAVESPRVSLLPGVMEEDVVALRKWEGELINRMTTRVNVVLRYRRHYSSYFSAPYNYSCLGKLPYVMKNTEVRYAYFQHVVT